MSFFTEDRSGLKNAIEFFQTLNPERQAYLVSNVSKDDGSFKQDEINNFTPVFDAIRNDMTSHNNPTITSELIELGMDRTYAVLLVENIVKEAPTISYQIKVLSKIPDDEFKIKIPQFVKLVWADNIGVDVVSKKIDTTDEQNRAIAEIFRTAMTEYLRSESSIDVITNRLKGDGLSETQLDVFINTLKINSEHWRHYLVFSNTQDTYFHVKTIQEQNKEILQLLNEIKKKINNDDNPSLGQSQK
jgi:hypothetical protein